MKAQYALSVINKKKVLILILVLSGIIFLLKGLYFMNHHPYMGETDTSLFLKFVVEVKSHGGVLSSFLDYFKGTFQQTNQHPLFPWLITNLYENNLNYFVNIKILNLIVGFIVIYLFYYLVQRNCDVLTAIIALLLLIANDTFLHQTTMVSCEPLLIIFTLLSFYYIYRGLDDNRYWAYAGVFTGFAYLTKASGLFIPFGFLMFLLYDSKGRFWMLFRNKYLWLYLLFFIIISLPLLVRNTIVFHFPFYNFNIEMLAWDESWSNVGSVTFFDIFKRDLGQNLHRFLRGIVRELRILVFSLYSFSIHYVPRFQFDTALLIEKIIGILVSVSIFVMGIAGFVRSNIGRRKKRLIIFLFIGFYLPLSWYSITSPNRRYILPVSIILLIFVASFIKDTLVLLVQKYKLLQEVNVHLTVQLIMTVVLFFTAIFYPLTHAIPKPSNTMKLEDGYNELAVFLRSNLSGEQKYLAKGEHYYPYFLLYPDIEEKVCKFPKRFKDLSEFNTYFHTKKEIRYFLIHQEVFRLIRHFTAEYLLLDQTKGLILRKELPGWKKIMEDKNGFCDYILLKKTNL